MSEGIAPVVFGSPGDTRQWVSCANEIARRIHVGEYKPGDLLPKAGQFARELHINPSSAAQAYRELQKKGLLSKSGAWYRIRERPAADPAPDAAHASAPEPAGSSEPLSGDEFMTASELAALLRVSHMTVYRLIECRDVEAVRVNRSFRIFKSSVNRYLNAGKGNA